MEGRSPSESSKDRRKSKKNRRKNGSSVSIRERGILLPMHDTDAGGPSEKDTFAVIGKKEVRSTFSLLYCRRAASSRRQKPNDLRNQSRAERRKQPL